MTHCRVGLLLLVGHAVISRTLIAIVFGGLYMIANPARAESWPSMSGAHSEVCAEALALADEAFRSSRPSLFMLPERLPAAVVSDRVVSPDGFDLSGGNALSVDPVVFETMDVPAEPFYGRIRWQKVADSGWRIVLSEQSRGWRGDGYTVYVLPKSVPPQEFLSAATLNKLPREWALFSGGLRPPLIFRTAQQKLWVVSQGGISEFLSPWTVYTLARGGPETECRIRFRPDVDKAVSLLPREVRELERLLDITMGSGADEGTLQPTAWLRVAVQQQWANVAVRPWALAAPYNTRAEVSEGLEKWASASVESGRLKRRIAGQTKGSIRALATYYAQTFGLSHKQSIALAEFAIDAAVRSHYVFPKVGEHAETLDTLGRNPWGSPTSR